MIKSTSRAISAILGGNQAFEISGGDYRAEYADGSQFEVNGSTANDGYYTVSSTVYAAKASKTYVYPTISIPDPGGDGNIWSTNMAIAIHHYSMAGGL